MGIILLILLLLSSLEIPNARTHHNVIVYIENFPEG